MRTLFLDIETTPNVVYKWDLRDTGPSSIEHVVMPSHVLCFAYKWEGDRKVTFVDPLEEMGDDFFYFGRQSTGHEEMIGEAHYLLSEADVVVTYNGDGFDLPILHGEFAQLGRRPPEPYKSLDHYKTYRQNFKLPSGKLAWLTQALGLSGKAEHGGLKTWIGCIEGDAASWRKMRKYNMKDVSELEALHKILLPWVKSPPNRNLYDDTQGMCPRCGLDTLQKRGVRPTQTGMYQRYFCTSCLGWSTSGKALRRSDVR